MIVSNPAWQDGSAERFSAAFRVRQNRAPRQIFRHRRRRVVTGRFWSAMVATLRRCFDTEYSRSKSWEDFVKQRQERVGDERL